MEISQSIEKPIDKAATQKANLTLAFLLMSISKSCESTVMRLINSNEM